MSFIIGFSLMLNSDFIGIPFTLTNQGSPI